MFNEPKILVETDLRTKVLGEDLLFNFETPSLPLLPENYHVQHLRGLSDAELKAVTSLRARVWRKEGVEHLGDTVAAWSDHRDQEATTKHCFLREQGRLIGAARVTFHQQVSTLQDSEYYLPHSSKLPLPLASVTKMVVDPEHQGKGCGTFLHAWAIRMSSTYGAAAIACDVPEQRRNLVERVGYSYVADTGPQTGWPADMNWIIVVRNFRSHATCLGSGVHLVNLKS